MLIKNYKISFTNIKTIPIIYNIILIIFLIFHFYNFNGNKLYLKDYIGISFCILLIFLVVFLKYEKQPEHKSLLFEKVYHYFNDSILSLDENKLRFCNVVYQINDCEKQVIRQMPINGSLIYQFNLNQTFNFHSEKESFTIIYFNELNKNILYGKFNNLDLCKDIGLFSIKECNVNKKLLTIEINKNKPLEIKHDLNSFKIWFDTDPEILKQKEFTV